jgi:hypothetical protein
MTSDQANPCPHCTIPRSSAPRGLRKTSTVKPLTRTGLTATIFVGMLAACGSGSRHAQPTTSTSQNVPTSVVVDPITARFGQAFRLGKLTVVVADAGMVSDASPAGPPRRRLVVTTDNESGVSDRAPGLAVVCEQSPQLSGGSLYADPHPQPRPFVAGKTQSPGAKDTASITVALSPSCPAPALQISPGGATINGLPRPVLIPMR